VFLKIFLVSSILLKGGIGAFLFFFGNDIVERRNKWEVTNMTKMFIPVYKSLSERVRCDMGRCSS
jgi:hypothetical protein